MPLRNDATRHRTALLLGLTSGDAVVAWADDQLLRESAPPDALIDVSLTAPTDLSALRIALEPLADDPVPASIVEEMLAQAARDLISGRRSVADSMHLFRQVRLMLPLTAARDAALDDLIDAHMLAVAGIGSSVDDVEARVREWSAGVLAATTDQ